MTLSALQDSVGKSVKTLTVLIREMPGPLFEDGSFAQAFAKRGRPAVSPGALALVSVLQHAKGHTDRQAAHQVRGRMDWKFLVGVDLDDPGFDFSVLCAVRSRLIEHGLAKNVLDLVLARCSELGLLCSGGRQRTDSRRRSVHHTASPGPFGTSLGSPGRPATTQKRPWTPAAAAVHGCPC
ncbi:transposase [Streptomyces sp. NPDC054919]